MEIFILTATITKNFYDYIKIKENVMNFKKSKGIQYEFKTSYFS